MSSTRELQLARAIVDEHGDDSLSPFILRPDKAFAFAAGGVLAYRVIRRTIGALAAMLVITLAGTGLLYGLRGLHWFGLGPSIGDALPLLQLAGFDGQPLLRVVVAWAPAGIVIGLVLIRFAPPWRHALVAALALLLLLFASDASYALARNLRLDAVLSGRAPTLGPWREAMLLVVGSAVPAAVASADARPGLARDHGSVRTLARAAAGRDRGRSAPRGGRRAAT